MAPFWIHFVVMFAAAAYVLRRGGRYEKLAASCYLLTNMLLLGYGAGDGTLPYELELGIYVVEALCFTALAVWSKRSWVLVACLVAYLEGLTAAGRARLALDAWTYGSLQLTYFYWLWTIFLAAAWTSGRRASVQAAE